MDIEQLSTGTDPNQYVWRGNRPISASLLSRLSEAADGIRNNEEIYFVAQLEPAGDDGHDIVGHFPSVQHAFDDNDAQPLLLTGDYMIFGPFKTMDDPDYKKKPIAKIIVVPKGGKELHLSGDKFDCIFWSLSAIDKFVVPYYTASGDLKKAKKVRDKFMDENTLAGIHIPGSDIVNGVVDGLTPEDVKSRVGIYLLKSEKRVDDHHVVFIPL